MAAGLGFKDFVTGEVLTAADVDGYLMQGVWVFASAAARDAAVTSPQEGNFAYLKDTNVTTYYTGSAWANLDTTGMTNPMTTTGDTIYSSSGSTPARLGIGSTGQVLTVAGGVPTWATAGGGSMTLLSTTSLSGASTTVSSISGAYKHLYIEVANVEWSGTVNDSGRIATNLTGQSSNIQAKIPSNAGTYLLNGVDYIDDGGQYMTGNNGNNFMTWTIYNYASTTDMKVYDLLLIYNGSSSTARVSNWQGGIYSKSAVNSITYDTMASATLTAGTIRVYGVN